MDKIFQQRAANWLLSEAHSRTQVCSTFLLAFFAPYVEEDNEAPNESYNGPRPSPRTCLQNIERLQQTDNADNKKRKSAEPVEECIARFAKAFLAFEEHGFILLLRARSARFYKKFALLD